MLSVKMPRVGFVISLIMSHVHGMRRLSSLLRCACGAILSDATGSFIAAAVEFKQYALDAPTMEAFAVLLGL